MPWKHPVSWIVLGVDYSLSNLTSSKSIVTQSLDTWKWIDRNKHALSSNW